MLRLPTWRWPARARTSVHAVLIFPDSTETRRFDKIPTPGTRLRSHGGDLYSGRTFVVDEVLQSGIDTYTVILVDRRRYVGNLRERSEGDLAAELLELARRTSETVDETRRRIKRGYLRGGAMRAPRYAPSLREPPDPPSARAQKPSQRPAWHRITQAWTSWRHRHADDVLDRDIWRMRRALYKDWAGWLTAAVAFSVVLGYLIAHIAG